MKERALWYSPIAPIHNHLLVVVENGAANSELCGGRSVIDSGTMVAREARWRHHSNGSRGCVGKSAALDSDERRVSVVGAKVQVVATANKRQPCNLRPPHTWVRKDISLAVGLS